MNTESFITELFIRVDDQMQDVKKHSQSNLYPGEITTLALLFSIKEVGGRAFYRWFLPKLSMIFRDFSKRCQWTIIK